MISFAHQCFGIGYDSVRGNFGGVLVLFLSFQFRMNKIESSSCEKKQTNKQKQKPCGWRSNIGNDYDVFRGLGPGACLSKIPIAFRAQKPGVIDRLLQKPISCSLYLHSRYTVLTNFDNDTTKLSVNEANLTGCKL